MSTNKLDLRNEQRAILRAMESAIAKARAAGHDEVEVYIECEGPVIHVMDEALRGAGDRANQDAILGSMSLIKLSVKVDVGAW